MAVIDKQSQEQKRGGTFNENLVRLQAQFHKIAKDGISTKGLHNLIGHFIKSAENIRIDCNRQIRKIEAELNFNEGTAYTCAYLSNFFMSLLESYTGEGLLSGVSPEKLKNMQEEKAKQDAVAEREEIVQSEKSDEDEIFARIREEERVKAEMLKKYCANCGCQDEGDMAKCDCSCHDGKHCGNENCIICNDLSNYKFLRKKKRVSRRKKK